MIMLMSSTETWHSAEIGQANSLLSSQSSFRPSLNEVDQLPLFAGEFSLS